MPSFSRLLSIALFGLANFASISGLAQAQTSEPAPVLPGRPDANAVGPAAVNNSELLGGGFESPAAGIAFRAPADCKETRYAGGSDLVSYVNEQKRWALKVNRLMFSNPIEMTYHKEDADRPQSRDVNGLFQETIDRLKTDAPGIEIHRQEIVPIGPLDVGMIVGKYNVGNENNLVLIALVRERPADVRWDASYVYYSFNFNASLPVLPKGTDLLKDPQVQQAVNTFNAVIDTIRILDQSALREDQNRRLFRTRSLLVNLTEPKLRAAIVPEQWFRVIKDGKDIGYTYIIEETGRDLPRHGQREVLQSATNPEGVLIGMRSRTVPEAGVQIDSESWAWASFDRRHEKFTTSSGLLKLPETVPDVLREIGWCDTLTRLIKDDSLLPGQERIGKDKSGVDRSQPSVRQTEVTSLHVSFTGKSRAGEPIDRDLPPFYMPQAIGQLLPRVLAKMSPGKTYLFAAYNGSVREVMMRYVDVGEESLVELDHQKVRAIPVLDRMGMEGMPTTHYITADGKYLGSVNPDQKITILPTDAITLEQLWKGANLSRPAEVEDKR